MSNAEEEEKIMAEIERVDAIADAAWREWEQTHALDNGIPPTCFRSGFALGYTRGRADALVLPEVRAEEFCKYCGSECPCETPYRHDDLTFCSCGCIKNWRDNQRPESDLVN